MAMFRVDGIVWDTDGVNPEELGLPKNVNQLQCDDIDDISEALEEKYGYPGVYSFSGVEELRAKVVKKYQSLSVTDELIHADLPMDEAKELCALPESTGEGWFLCWYQI